MEFCFDLIANNLKMPEAVIYYNFLCFIVLFLAPFYQLFWHIRLHQSFVFECKFCLNCPIFNSWKRRKNISEFFQLLVQKKKSPRYALSISLYLWSQKKLIVKLTKTTKSTLSVYKNTPKNIETRPKMTFEDEILALQRGNWFEICFFSRLKIFQFFSLISISFCCQKKNVAETTTTKNMSTVPDCQANLWSARFSQSEKNGVCLCAKSTKIDMETFWWTLESKFSETLTPVSQIVLFMISIFLYFLFHPTKIFPCQILAHFCWVKNSRKQQKNI